MPPDIWIGLRPGGGAGAVPASVLLPTPIERAASVRNSTIDAASQPRVTLSLPCAVSSLVVTVWSPFAGAARSLPSYALPDGAAKEDTHSIDRAQRRPDNAAVTQSHKRPSSGPRTS